MLFVLVSKATTQHLSNKDAAFVFPVLQGDAEKLVAWVEKICDFLTFYDNDKV